MEKSASRHTLSQIDVKKMKAICAVCGQTDIRKRRAGKYTVYICATKKQEYARAYRLQHAHPRIYPQTAHVLSNVDYENKTAFCSQCGPVKIYISPRKGRAPDRHCSKANIASVMRAQAARKAKI